MSDFQEVSSSIGSIATAVGLLYLFYKDYNKNNRISNLEKVAKTLEKDLKLKYQPHLWLNGLRMRQQENELWFDLNNKREWCKLLEFNVISGDLIIDEVNKHLPCELEPKFNEGIVSDTTRRWIYTINSSGKRLDDVEYEIEIIYEDRLNNKYFTKIKGKGEKFKLTAPKYL
ncbi:hypothetical protein [Polaribacter sp. HaHaR_3_91]|uniref:hypothetical protein n=1 Tax=Polaribacter sp. HaHaR_3_91 TaxID=2745561 RepID=UPI001C4F1AE3|nr:hypothetical protein [Polaribacter sp. HaHaR_3_91]QXP63246.1 hypothetical protein H0I27_15565 [Polaribacter sp. HaHaR_3_91]